MGWANTVDGEHRSPFDNKRVHSSLGGGRDDEDSYEHWVAAHAMERGSHTRLVATYTGGGTLPDEKVADYG